MRLGRVVSALCNVRYYRTQLEFLTIFKLNTVAKLRFEKSVLKVAALLPANSGGCMVLALVEGFVG